MHSIIQSVRLRGFVQRAIVALTTQPGENLWAPSSAEVNKAVLKARDLICLLIFEFNQARMCEEFRRRLHSGNSNQVASSLLNFAVQALPTHRAYFGWKAECTPDSKQAFKDLLDLLHELFQGDPAELAAVREAICSICDDVIDGSVSAEVPRVDESNVTPLPARKALKKNCVEAPHPPIPGATVDLAKAEVNQGEEPPSPHQGATPDGPPVQNTEDHPLKLPDGPFDPFSFRWKGQEKEFLDSQRRYCLLLSALWPSFRLKKAISCEHVNQRLCELGGSRITDKTMGRYANHLSEILSTLEGFPADIKKVGKFICWQELK